MEGTAAAYDPAPIDSIYPGWWQRSCSWGSLRRLASGPGIASTKINALLAEKAKEQEATRIEGLVGRLVSAEPTQIPDIVKQLDANPQLASTSLVTARLADRDDAGRKTRTTPRPPGDGLPRSIARSNRWPRNCSVARSPTSRRFARNCGPSGTPTDGEIPRHPRDEKADRERRFRAALALADYVPESERASWTDQDLKLVAEQLVASNAEFQPLCSRCAVADPALDC